MEVLHGTHACLRHFSHLAPRCTLTFMTPPPKSILVHQVKNGGTTQHACLSETILETVEITATSFHRALPQYCRILLQHGTTLPIHRSVLSQKPAIPSQMRTCLRQSSRPPTSLPVAPTLCASSELIPPPPNQSFWPSSIGEQVRYNDSPRITTRRTHSTSAGLKPALTQTNRFGPHHCQATVRHRYTASLCSSCLLSTSALSPQINFAWLESKQRESHIVLRVEAQGYL